MRTNKAFKFTTAIAAIVAISLLLPVVPTALAEETETYTQSQVYFDISTLSDREVIANINALIADEEFKASMAKVPGIDTCSDEDARLIASGIRGMYLSEHYQEYLEAEKAGIMTPLSSSGPSGTWHFGGAYSSGVGEYPTAKGKILVTTDWLAIKNIEILPTGHAAIVENVRYAWSSFPAMGSSANGLNLGYDIEGVQREANDWFVQTRHATCFGLDVKQTSASQESAAVDWCANQTGKPYNFNFLNVDTRSSFYCSQLVWAAFKDLYGIDMNTMSIPVAPGKIYTPVHPLNLVDSNETALIYRQGTARTGWQNVNGSDYYIDSKGNPLKGRQSIDGKAYYFDSTGALAHEDGVYTIETTLSSPKLFDIVGASTSDGAALQTFSANRTPAQRFRLAVGNDGYYTITNVNSNRALDVPGANAVSGAGIIQYLPNGTDAQKWSIVRTGAGASSVYLVPKLNQSLRLGVQGSSTAAGIKIQLQTASTSNAQIFELKKIDRVLPTEARTDAQHYYTIEASYVNKVFDVVGGSATNGANVQIYAPNGTKAQEFEFRFDAATGYYTIINVNSGKALDVTGASAANGANVQIWANNGTSAQKWSIEKNGNRYRLYSACGGLALDIPGASTANGANVQTWTANGTKAQDFILTAVRVVSKTLPDGVYTIGAAYTNKVLDIAGGSTANGANVQLYTPNGSAAQKFKVTLLDENGRYAITNASSGMALDVSGTAVGANVHMWQPTGASNQRWYLWQVDSVHYRLIALSNSKLLDALNSGTANGTNVRVWWHTSTTNQLWKFTKVG
jgi:uncharacterized protein YycO